jgi:hypothetical protein
VEFVQAKRRKAPSVYDVVPRKPFRPDAQSGETNQLPQNLAEATPKMIISEGRYVCVARNFNAQLRFVKLSRLSGVSEAVAEREPDGEILSAAKELFLSALRA